MAVETDGRRRRHAPDPVTGIRQGRQSFQPYLLRYGVQCAELGNPRRALRSHEGASQRIEVQGVILGQQFQAHARSGQGFPEGLPHAGRAAYAAGQYHAFRRDAGLQEGGNVLADGVEQSGQDALAILALVGLRKSAECGARRRDKLR